MSKKFTKKIAYIIWIYAINICYTESNHLTC